MNIMWQRQPLLFEAVELQFDADQFKNVFAHKNNKTVAETLAHPRYQKLQSQVMHKYSQYLKWELGKFLAMLKSQGDSFYLTFLNKYGDLTYCRFYIEDERYLNKKWVIYLFDSR